MSKIRTQLKRVSQLRWKTLPIIIGLVASIGFAAPHPAHAAGAVFTVETASMPEVLKKVDEKILQGLKSAAYVGFKNSIRVMFEKVSYETAVWLASGDSKQKPLVRLQALGKSWVKAGDSAAGEFFDTLATKNGYVKLNLCQLPDVQSMNLQIMLPQITEKKPKEANCTLTQMGNQFKNRYEKAVSFIEDPTSLAKVSVGYGNAGSGLSTTLAAWDASVDLEATAEKEEIVAQIKSDYKPQESKIAGYIETPAAAVEAQAESVTDKATDPESLVTGDVIADSVSIFVNTLASKLIERYKSGFFEYITTPDVGEFAGGEYGAATSAGAGIAGAKEKFASFQTPAFKQGGEIDIVDHLANCPDQGADVTNCVIDSAMQTAIREQKTVREAIEQGPLNETFEMNLRMATILRRYSIVPAGWQLAAEYHQDFDQDGSLRLKDLMDAYDDCGEGGTYSPYCGLVDPNWVLKAPDVLCKLEGYGEVLATTPVPVNSDGNEYTPEDYIYSRLNTCLDSQSCLSEDENGNCLAYGYCTEQRRIYKFQGDSCPAYASSCTAFENSSGDQVAYLTNTVNYNDCSADNAGCQWYCSATDADGNYTCVDSTADNSIHFDNDVSTCPADDAGCNEFIGVKGGANILFNPDFDQFNGDRRPRDETLVALPETGLPASQVPFDDTIGFYGQQGGGAACTQSAGDQLCYGWEQLGGSGVRITQDLELGIQVAELKPGSGYIQSSFETGQALKDRSFVLSFTSRNTTGEAGCTGQYWIEAASDFVGASVDKQAFTIDYPVTGEYQQTSSDRITFDNSVNEQTIRVGISAGSSCTVAIDSVKLEENVGGSGYADYGEQSLSLNVNKANTCTQDEVGCQMYTPQTGESTAGVAGIVTNEYADSCTGPDGFKNPSCSQCKEEFVGCDAFIEEETPYTAPVKDNTLLTGDVSEQTATAVAERRGYYCDGTADPCNSDSECTAGSSCLPSISVIPATGETCSAANVGCEEYVNLDTVASGGEGLEYYKYIRQCVKPTTEQQNNGEIATYYTFEGSDDTGYQIRSWNLKKSNITQAQSAGIAGAPCTNLDLYGSSAQTPEANCIDTVDTVNTCDASDVGDGECLEFYDSAGRTYYVNQSATISVSDECVGLRNSLDGRTYYSIPDESQSCPSSENLCREFKGSQAEATEQVIDENFNAGVWGGDASAEVVTANTGFSMALGTAATSQRGITDVKDKVSVQESYVVTFWAKKSSDSDAQPVKPMFVSGGQELYFENIDVTTDWRQYTAGPFVFENGLKGDEQFGFRFDGAQANIDNVQLYQNDSHYLIQGSSDICHGYEGCEEYEDANSNQLFLKSFAKLCGEDVVGCQALINTHNADLPYYEKFNTDNEFAEDDVEVSVHSVETYAVTEEAKCDSEYAGCTAYGQPTLNANGTTDGDGNGKPDEDSFTQTYLINDPDSYGATLCQDQQLQCAEFKGTDGSLSYFKDPGDKVCEYNTDTGVWETAAGDPCPVQNSSVSPSQPKGPVCNDGERKGQMCNTDSDCRTSDSDPVSYRCVSTEADSGYVGSCPAEYNGCTSYLDPNAESAVINSDFETDSVDNANVSSGISDGLPDNWARYATDATACKTFNYTEDQHHDGGRAAQLATDTSKAASCMVASDTITVDANSIYTLSGYVYATDPSAEFSIGMIYYDATGTQISIQDGDVYDYAIAAYEGGSRGSITVGAWQRFHVDIGPNLVRAFPQGTYFVKVYIETGNSNQTVNFDTVELTKNDEYTYINDSVDGAPQSDTNSCSTGIDAGAGCVAMRDVTNDALTYVADNDVIAETCTFDSANESEACRSRANASDTNVIIKVQNDRECAQWLACASEVRTEGATDDSKNCFETGNCSCLDIRKCIQRNEETGACTQWATKVNPKDLGYDDDASITSSPNDTSDLDSIQNVSGFATVGATWTGAYCDDSSGTCVGGGNHGQTCDTGCTDGISYGYYPYDWMPQVGLGGAATTEDPVKHGDFEDVYCNGSGAYDDAQLSGNPALINALENSRNKEVKCTADWHCRTPQLDALFQREDLYTGSSNVADIHYEKGWCGNVSEDSWQEWDTLGGQTKMSVLDYTDELSYVKLAELSGYESITGANIGAKSLDLDNVMYVEPHEDNVAEGLQSELFEGIAQGQEYTLSFDASYLYDPKDNDNIQVGFEHGSDSAAVDYMEVGQSFADVVFVVDVSGSMSDEIADVANNTSALVQGFQEAGIDYRVGIVTTGGSRDPRTETFGDSNFTSNITEFSDRMTFLSQNLEPGSQFSYEAMKGVADNTFDLDYRAGAIKFVVLLTDAKPENGDDYIKGGSSATTWQQADEDNFLTLFDGAPYTLYSIRSATAADAYDLITTQFGGLEYDINGDYSVLLQDITSDMDTKVSNFKFTTKMQHYVLGPMTIQNKFDNGATSTLFIREGSLSANTPFVIDNISLKPALELNKENNPGTENATWMAGQSCRAYPRQDSAQCDYISTGGEIYSGWKGYCLEYDPDDFNKENKRCLTWWPIDVVAGDEDTTGAIQQIKYNQKFPVYTCLVAKGNENLGACTDDGTICTENGDCGNSQCLGNGTSVYEPTGKVSDPIDVKVETGGYKVTHTISSLPLDQGFGDNELSHEDPVDPIDGFANWDVDKHEAAVFEKFNPSRVEQLVHISEIDHIQFFLGDPRYTDNAGDTNDENHGYEQEEGWQAWWMDGNDTVEGGRYSINGFDSLAWESNPNGELFTSVYKSKVEGVFSNERAESQEIQESGEAEAEDAHGIMAMQAGAWCGNVICTEENLDQTSVDDIDFVFVKGVSGFRNSDSVDRLKGAGHVFNDKDADGDGDPYNPFNQFDEIANDSTVWGKRTLITSADNSVPQAGGKSFDKEYFQSRYPEDISDADERECFDTINFNELGGCGANIMGVKFDFEDGYLKNVYLFYWDGFHRFDAKEIKNISWTYYLKEPCLLVAEGANDAAVATPWYDRIQPDSGYRVKGIPYAHAIQGVNQLYGSIGGNSSNSTPDTLDGASSEGLVDFTATGDNLPFVYLNAAEGSGLPFACIGDCGGTACQNADWTTDYSEEDSCTSNGEAWIGVPGICSELDEDKVAHFCDDDNDCSQAGLGTCKFADGSSKSVNAPPQFSAQKCPVDDPDCGVQGGGNTGGTNGGIDPDQDSGTNGGSLGENDPTGYTGNAGTNSTLATSSLSGAGSNPGYSTYLQQLNAAARVGWDRYRLLFADTEHVWFANQDPNHNNRYSAALIDTPNGESDSADDDRSIVDFCPLEDFACDAFNEDPTDESPDYRDNDTMNVCGPKGHAEADQYCGVRPTVQNMTLNGDAREFEIDNGDTLSLQFDSSVDPSQVPIEYVRIVWEGQSGTAFADETWVQKTWGGESTDNHFFRHVFACDINSASADGTNDGICTYRVKVQVQDAWGFCSGESDQSVVRDQNFAGACTSYTEYPFNVRVKL